MKKPFFFFCIFVCLFNSFTVVAQHGLLRFEHIGTREGLSHSNVISILRDSRGFMWFGTRDGLNRYDGYTFTTFKNDPQDTSSISNNTIISMVEDNEGYIWIATWGGGLNRFDRNTEKFQRFQHDPAVYASLASNLLNTLMLDHNNVLWIGTEDAGFDRFDRHGKTFIHTPNNNILQFSSVKSMHEDNNHRVWIGTNENGLHVFDPATSTAVVYAHNDKDVHSLSGNSIKVIFADSHHRLWIGTRGAGLNVFEPATNSFTRFRHNDEDEGSLCHDYVVAMNEDESGNVWIGTENGGLSILPPNSNVFNNYTQDDIDPESLSSNSIWTIYRDNHNDMWIGTYSGDINFWSSANNQFAHLRHTSSPFSLSHNKVLSILEDSHKNIWIGTDGGGLNLYDPATRQFTHFLHDEKNKNSICGNFVLSLAEDKHGNIWVGTWGSGISIFDPKTRIFRHMKNVPGDAHSLGSNNIYGMYRDRDDHMWLATYYGGLNRYDDSANTFIRYQHNDNDPSSISSNKINSVFQDSRGQLWVSTDGNGLEKFDVATGKFTHYVHDENTNSISNNNVGKIYEDARGNLWIGTMSGLNYLDIKKGTFDIFRMAQGMPNDAVFGIIADSQQKLWLSTNKGLSRFDPLSRTFHNYTEADGLQSDEFKLNAACKTSNGALLFGGNNGFNEFEPAALYTEPYTPPLVMSKFMIMNRVVTPATDSTVLTRPITETHALRLPYSSSVISFEFTALHYRSFNKKQYSYMLEGFDDTWNDIGNKRTATYTNLDPGSYVFLVRTQDGSGKWSENTLRMELTIVPPFWMTWWFRCLVVFAWIAAIVILYRRRVNSLDQQKKKLQELVDQQTHELKELNSQEHEARMDAERARQEADQANRAKSVFLATMSHEIRTPMNGVIGMASLLEATELTPEQRSYAETISTCGENLLKVINDILDFSKIESGNFELESSEVNLRQIIEEVLEVFAAKSAETGIDLLYDLDNHVPATIMGDSHRLRQILLNLVGNATKFTNRGEVLITVKLLALVNKEAQLEFTVRDTGIGIPSDKVNRLFQAFMQVDSSTTRKYGGTGLGLVICEKLVNMMGGKISVSSIEGAGTCFSFTIKTQAVTEPQITPSSEEIDVKGKHILIVDDNATNLTILKSQMEKLGASCFPVLSGEEALAAIAKGNAFDLVLADMQMPVMDGVQLAQQIKKQHADLPIILLTSLGEDISIQHPGLFHSVLIKPVRQHLLHQHVLKALNKSMAATSEGTIAYSALHEDFAIRNPLRIMLVEDNLINQLLATTILTKLGYKPYVANNGREAIDLLSQQTFDLILMDMQMPEMDGVEATKYIRQHFEVQPVIIAMTANAMQEDREICLQAGMNDYLSKPVKPEDLVMMVEKWSLGSAA